MSRKRNASTAKLAAPAEAPKHAKMTPKAELRHLVRNDLFSAPGTVYDILMGQSSGWSTSLRGDCTLETKGANKLELKLPPAKTKAEKKRRDDLGNNAYWLGGGMWTCVPKAKGDPKCRIGDIKAIDDGILLSTTARYPEHRVWLDHATPGEQVTVEGDRGGRLGKAKPEFTITAQQGDLVLVYCGDIREVGTVLFRPRMSKEAAAKAAADAAALAGEID